MHLHEVTASAQGVPDQLAPAAAHWGMAAGQSDALFSAFDPSGQELALKVGKEQTVELFETAGVAPKAHAFTNPQRRASSRDITAAVTQAAVAMAK